MALSMLNPHFIGPITIPRKFENILRNSQPPLTMQNPQIKFSFSYPRSPYYTQIITYSQIILKSLLRENRIFASFVKSKQILSKIRVFLETDFPKVRSQTLEIGHGAAVERGA